MLDSDRDTEYIDIDFADDIEEVEEFIYFGSLATWPSGKLPIELLSEFLIELQFSGGSACNNRGLFRGSSKSRRAEARHTFRILTLKLNLEFSKLIANYIIQGSESQKISVTSHVEEYLKIISFLRIIFYSTQLETLNCMKELQCISFSRKDGNKLTVFIGCCRQV